jgi:hypothetical protein
MNNLLEAAVIMQDTVQLGARQISTFSAPKFSIMQSTYKCPESRSGTTSSNVTANKALTEINEGTALHDPQQESKLPQLFL